METLEEKVARLEEENADLKKELDRWQGVNKELYRRLAVVRLAGEREVDYRKVKEIYDQP